MFRKMPVILVAILLLIYFLDGVMPYQLKCSIYALSLSAKSVITFILPFLIFMLLFKTISQLSRNATKMLAIILIGLSCSNFLSTMISYTIGKAVYHMDLSIAPPQSGTPLIPSWSLHLPKLIANDHAMFSGIILGVLFSLFRPQLGAKIGGFFEKVVAKLLRILNGIIPVFIGGFFVKLISEKTLNHMLHEYTLILCIIGASVFIYIVGIYFLSNRFHVKDSVGCIKNMLPAVITGFGAMSSVAAMPLTISAVEKNSKGSPLSRLAVPMTISTHLIGDCFAIPILAFAVLKNFGAPEPLFLGYLLFAIYFVIAKFSVAAVPGGGIIVMLPILENQLGFTPEMGTLITALYILFDPVITCANVFGNGAFATALNRIKKTA